MYDAQHIERIRTTTKRLDALHSASYFSPAVARALAEIGLTHPSGGYFAARSAALGRVPASVVAATFYSFNADFISEFVPACWDLAAPEAVLAARHRGVEEMMAEIFTAEGVETDALADAAAEVLTLLQPVLEVMLPDGRTLFAAHAEALSEGIATSDGVLAPLTQLWAAVTLLREYRGDGHIAALLAHDLTGLESVILHVASGTSFTARAARRSRGWSHEIWETYVEGLIDNGLLQRTGQHTDAEAADPEQVATGGLALTDEAIVLREAIEDATDDTVAHAWSMLDEHEHARLAELATPLARTVVKSGVFPAKVFAPGSGMVRRR
ncbi:SCO6745 family protein [Brevibacterium luteolum]|uniref:SalK n=1 Tax=Brevibacterium luteolum TaxID=199591 RepID=A0A2N6PJF9_9MICO|nr:hypothetical protein [Brevibacterium luteolum]MCT1657665.1 hypothetical protein [Brevibacterium luteolum]PMB98830.1 hypothetical protein CJ198_05895 [Brevibacterium luteolum]